MQFISNSEKQTFNFAKKFSKKFRGGEVIGLIGDLGAGKTIFTKGLAAGLGIKKNITSPTFVLARIYPATKHRLINFFVHIDAYRIKKPDDLTSIGVLEYFNQPNTVTTIEWADKIKKILPKKAKLIKFYCFNNKRKIIF